MVENKDGNELKKKEKNGWRTAFYIMRIAFYIIMIAAGLAFLGGEGFILYKMLCNAHNNESQEFLSYELDFLGVLVTFLTFFLGAVGLFALFKAKDFAEGIILSVFENKYKKEIEDKLTEYIKSSLVGNANNLRDESTNFTDKVRRKE